MHDQTTFVAFDCETTGLEATTDKIIELGATRFSLMEDLQTFDSLFDPGTRLPAVVKRITGISDEELAGQPRFAEKQAEVEALLADATLVGHNVQFDVGFVQAAGVDLSAHPTFDTFDVAGLVLQKTKSQSLIALAEQFGCLHEAAHRALSDAEATRDLFRALTATAQQMPRAHWEQVANLQVTEISWLQRFAQLVLTGDQLAAVAQKEDPLQPLLAADERLVDVLASCPADIGSLIETSHTTADLAVATQQPTLLVTAGIFEATELAARANATLVLAPQFYPDPDKVAAFCQRKLSPVAAVFAAKLILHPGATFFQLNLNRAERLLWSEIAADDLPEQIKLKIENVQFKITVTHHASLPELAAPAATAGRRVVVHTSMRLPIAISGRDAVALDLPALETLCPGASTELAFFWGQLGILLRDAEPLYGRVELANTTGLPAYIRMVDSGQKFLEAASSELPAKLRELLAAYLRADPAYQRGLRTDSGGNITLSIEPKEATTGNPATELSNAIFVDSALATGSGNFAFAQKQLGLTSNVHTAQLPPSGPLPQLVVAHSMPEPAAPDFQKEADKKLLELIDNLPGITVVFFGSRYQMGVFFDKTHDTTNRVFGDRLTGSVGKNFLELSKEENATYLTSGHMLPPRTRNLVLVRLPWVVRDGADWQTETLPQSVLQMKKIWNQLLTVESRPDDQQLICLDARLTTKNYGTDFAAATGVVPVAL